MSVNFARVRSVGAGGVIYAERLTEEKNLCEMLKRGHESTLWPWPKCFRDSVLKPDSAGEVAALGGGACRVEYTVAECGRALPELWAEEIMRTGNLI